MNPGRRHLRRDRGRNNLRLGIGAALLLALAFYISSTANRGLPWKSSFDLSVELPRAVRLQHDDEVRIAGVRVGRVKSVEADPPSGGRPTLARVDLALDSSVDSLPVDTVVRVRPSSVLGASYIDLTPGRSSKDVAEGGTLPLGNAPTSVDLADLLDVFDKSSARHIQSAVGELGAGFAGRGPAVNATLHSVSELLGPLASVSGALAAGETRLDDFLRGYESFIGELEPAAPELAGLAAGGSATFGALARERSALAATLEALPGTESAVTTGFTRLQPSLDGLSRLATQLRPAGRILPGTLDQINTTVAAGVRPLRVLPRFSRKLGTALTAVDRVAGKPATDGAVRKLRDTVAAAEPTLDLLTTAQVNCNIIPSWSLWFGEIFRSYGLGKGPSFVNFGVTHLGAEGEALQAAKPSRNAGINYLPNENAYECESGNEGHDGVTQMINNPPGSQGHLRPTTRPPGDDLERARAAGVIGPVEGRR